MKTLPISRLALVAFAAVLLTYPSAAVSAQTPADDGVQGKRKPRPLVITLETGEQLRGELIRVDTDVVEFTVRNILQAVSLDDVKSIEFKASTQSSFGVALPERGDSALWATRKPVILYQEKARYTAEARKNRVSGTVILSAVFNVDGRLSGIRVIQGLPDGLTESAIEAAKKVRFQPATENGSPVSCRSTLEFNFSPY